MKLTIIGGGSFFTPLLLKGLKKYADEFEIDTVALLDIDEHGVNTIANYCENLFRELDLYPIKLTACTDHQSAIEGSDFIIFTIRVGGLKARAHDEKIPLKYGIVGDETIGPGGFSNSLRTIPVMVAYAKEIERWAPDAWVIPFTNPEGILTEAISRHSRVRVIGLCTAPYGLVDGIAKHLGVKRSDIRVDFIGLTHIGWVSGIYLNERNILPEIIQKAYDMGLSSASYPIELLRYLKAVPAHWFFSLIRRDYPHWFYHHDKIVKRQKRARMTRAEKLMAMQKDLTSRDFQSIPIAELEERRGHRVLDDPIFSLVSAIHNNKNQVHIVDIPCGGCVAGFSPEMVLEMPARVGSQGANPIPIPEISPEVRGLMQLLKAYEQLTIEAAVTGSYEAALQALIAHPLVMSYEKAQPLLDEILAVNKAYLPDYWNIQST